MSWLISTLRRRAFSQARRGGHRLWLVAGVALWMVDRARRRDDVLYRTRLDPGEGLLVRTWRPGHQPSAPDR